MPLGDGTGPAGIGPMTGRGAGYCAGYSVPGYMNPIPGRGYGYGWGRHWGWSRGYGWRWRARYWAPAPYAPVSPYNPYPNPEAEAEFLKTHIENLKNELRNAEERMEELKKSQKYKEQK